jgi:hypothetical protein
MFHNVSSKKSFARASAYSTAFLKSFARSAPPKAATFLNVKGRLSEGRSRVCDKPPARLLGQTIKLASGY